MIDINSNIVISAQAGIQKNDKIQLFAILTLFVEKGGGSNGSGE
jgi:hypothetical protein